MSCPYVPPTTVGTSTASTATLTALVHRCVELAEGDNTEEQRNAFATLMHTLRQQGGAEHPELEMLWSAILAQQNLTARKILRLLLWAPADPVLYLAVCSHPRMTDSVRMQLLTRSNGPSFATYQRNFHQSNFHQHIRDHHPLANALHTQCSPTVWDWSGHELDNLCTHLGDNLTTQRTAAALLATWTGSVDALIETVRGITAAASGPASPLS